MFKKPYHMPKAIGRNIQFLDPTISSSKKHYWNEANKYQGFLTTEQIQILNKKKQQEKLKNFYANPNETSYKIDYRNNKLNGNLKKDNNLMNSNKRLQNSFKNIGQHELNPLKAQQLLSPHFSSKQRVKSEIKDYQPLDIEPINRSKNHKREIFFSKVGQNDYRKKFKTLQIQNSIQQDDNAYHRSEIIENPQNSGRISNKADIGYFSQHFKQEKEPYTVAQHQPNNKSLNKLKVKMFGEENQLVNYHKKFSKQNGLPNIESGKLPNTQLHQSSPFQHSNFIKSQPPKNFSYSRPTPTDPEEQFIRSYENRNKDLLKFNAKQYFKNKLRRQYSPTYCNSMNYPLNCFRYV